MKKVKIDKESYGRLVEMFSSPDGSNHTVGLGILENCDIPASIPYILMLYKTYDSKVDGGFKSRVKLVKAVQKETAIELNGTILSSGKIWDIVKKGYSDEDKEVVLAYMASMFRQNLEGWGFKIFKGLELVLIEREQKS